MAKRDAWLNPPEWVAEVAAKVDAADDFAGVPADVRPLVRDSAIAAASAKDARLKKRTLTNLYNARPEWLKIAHETLDRAVIHCYRHVDPAGDWDEHWADVWRETGAGRPPGDDAAADVKTRRQEVDRLVLTNLLRLTSSGLPPPRS